MGYRNMWKNIVEQRDSVIQDNNRIEEMLSVIKKRRICYDRRENTN